jgi:hypothetical protein
MGSWEEDAREAGIVHCIPSALDICTQALPINALEGEGPRKSNVPGNACGSESHT